MAVAVAVAQFLGMKSAEIQSATSAEFEIRFGLLSVEKIGQCARSFVYITEASRLMRSCYFSVRANCSDQAFWTVLAGRMSPVD